MDQIKKAGREIETETKKKLRDVDGHDLGDDLANAGDEVKKDLGNAGDDIRRNLGNLEDDLEETGEDAHEEAHRNAP